MPAKLNMEKLYISGRLCMCPKTVLHIKRTLAGGKGTITAMIRQEVTPSDVLGEGITSSGFHNINLSKELGVNPNKALQYLKIKIGQTIFQGELIAQKSGMIGGKKNIIAPEDGMLDFYDEKSGNLKMKLAVKKNKLVSGVYGIVDYINHQAGEIIIRTQATIVYGILGSGKEREGVLTILGSAGDFITGKHITENLKGKIIVGGSLIFPNTLSSVMAIEASGFIAGGINVSDFKAMSGGKLAVSKQWSDIGTTVLVTEGFGMAPIGDNIFDILKSHENRFVVIDGNNKRLILPTNKSESMIDTRRTKLPETFCELLSGDVFNIELSLGKKVRVLSTAFLGMQGVVESIDKSETKLPSGVITYLVTVSGKRKIRVPYQNLEII
ncbi:MAG: hypothetical protein Q7R97_03825 [Candidatus Daviesbacteria bacterium]|nr:hypothetical protein [Candidatus Daviesbacteria bacterium]